MIIVNPKTALISLSDKTNLEEIVSFLIKKDVKILSTGGTYKEIKNLGFSCSNCCTIGERGGTYSYSLQLQSFPKMSTRKCLVLRRYVQYYYQ